MKFPPILHLKHVIAPYVLAAAQRREDGARIRFSLIKHLGIYRGTLAQNFAQELAKAIQVSLDHSIYDPSQEDIQKFVANNRSNLIIGSFKSFDANTILSMIKRGILTNEDAIRIAKYSVAKDPCDLIVGFAVNPRYQNNLGWAIDLVEQAEFGDACNAAFRLAIQSTIKNENGREISRLPNWAKAIIKFRPVGDPSGAAVMMYYSSLASEDFMREIIDEDDFGDPCGAIYKIRHFFYKGKKPDEYLTWMKKRLLTCKSGDPCYWLSKEIALLEDIDFVKEVRNRKIGTTVPEIDKICTT